MHEVIGQGRGEEDIGNTKAVLKIGNSRVRNTQGQITLVFSDFMHECSGQ